MLNQVINSLVRHRALNRRFAASCAKAGAKAGTGTTPTDKYEIFSTGGLESIYQQAPTLKRAIQAARLACSNFPGTAISIWSPDRCHVWSSRPAGVINEEL